MLLVVGIVDRDSNDFGIEAKGIAWIIIASIKLLSRRMARA
jgi:hypothetical protein